MSADTLVKALPCGSYEPSEVRGALQKVIEETVGWDWLRPGMRVGIKLNLCAAKKPEAAATTHPVMAAELTRLLVERGAEVVLGDSPGGPFSGVYLHRVYDACGLSLCEEAGGMLNEDYGNETVAFPEGKSIREYACCSWLCRCDALINFSKLKSHGLMGMTAAVKNLYGVIPGTVKSEYHYLHTDPADFADMLVDLNESVRPVLCLVDAVTVMEGNGPTMGSPRSMGLVLGGSSPYELDRLCAALLGIQESEIPYLQAAKARGLLSPEGKADPETVSQWKLTAFERSGATSSWFILTDRDKPLQKLAKKAMYVLLRSRPVVTEGCTGCGHCARDCPAKAIDIRDGKAYIQRRACVRCFCCQEFCPTGAMKVQRSLPARVLVHAKKNGGKEKPE